MSTSGPVLRPRRRAFRAVLAPLAAASVLVAAPRAAHGQDTYERRSVSQFDLAVDAGVNDGTSWFRADGREHAPSAGVTLGGAVTVWLSPTVGVDGRVQYLAGALERNAVAGRSGTMPVRAWTGDVSLRLRPFFWSARGLPSTVYAFVGAGAIHTSVVPGVADDTALGCAGAYEASNVCVLEHATRLQGALGIGADLAHLSPSVTLYAEAEAHVFRAPARLGGAPIDDASPAAGPRFALAPAGAVAAPAVHTVTNGRLVLGVRMGFGEILPPPPPPPPSGVDFDLMANGTVKLTAPEVGDEVYLIPALAVARSDAPYCGLRPDRPGDPRLGASFVGYTTAAPLVFDAAPRRWSLVVQQPAGPRRQARHPLAVGAGQRYDVTIAAADVTHPACRQAAAPHP